MATGELMRTLLARLIDDAGVFPPARLPMPDALAAHRQVADSKDAWLVGRFLSPESRLEEFALAAGRDRPELGIIVDTLVPDADSADVWAASVLVAKYEPTSVEVLASDEHPLMATVGVVLAGFAELPESTAMYVELPRGGAVADWPRAIETLGAAVASGRNVGAKVRCAGTTQDDVPTDSELAGFVVACRDHGTPFKATAGLHHAIRGQQDDGIDHHGFLNLLLACAVALSGDGDEAAVAAVLAERDPAVVMGAIRALTIGTAARVRGELLAAFGCCSPGEPIADLRELGLLEGH
jgi:hypothetical protein